jgi:uncharacterized protein (TIGR00297 family)
MTPSLLQIASGLVAAAVVALVAGRLRLLKPSGAWSAFVLGAIVFGLGGIVWSIPLLTFFILSSLLSKLGSKRVHGYRQQLEEVFEKGSTRDAGQVWANGGVAGAVVLLHTIWPQPELYMAYLGALAAAAADTWGTEIGVMYRGRVITVRSFRPAGPGTSGGISLAGTVGALAGALSIALSGIWWALQPGLSVIAVITASGVAGMLADSIVGSVWQASFRCVVCNATTERSIHCGVPATHVSGKRWMNNDAVNVICTLVGAMVALVIHLLL